MRLRLFLLVGFIAIAAVPVAVFALWPLTRPLENEVAQVADKHLLVARHVSHALTRYHRDAISVFEMVSGNLAADRSLPGSSRLLTNLHFRHICVLSLTNGSLIAAVTAKNESLPSGVPLAALRKLTKAAGINRTVMSPVSKDRQGRPAIYFARRLTGSRIAIGAIGTDYFLQLGKAVIFGKRGHAAIVDQTGTILAHPKPAWVAVQKNIAKIAPVKRMLGGDTGVMKFYSPALKADMIAGYTAVKGPGWGVMVPQPFQELEDRASAIRLQVRSVIMAGVVMAVLLALLFAARISRALAGVSSAARRMLAGDFHARARVPSFGTPRELRDLATVFNRMADALHRNHDDLERMVERRTRQLSNSERRLRSAKESAEQANEAKSAFLAQMSHELRTPLNAILGYSEFIAQEKLGPIGTDKYREYLKHIHDSGAHLRDVIGDILDASKLADEHMELCEEQVPLGSVIDACLIHVGPAAETAGVRLVTLHDGDLPEIWADRTRLIQIIDNVLSNAVKFTPAGGSIQIMAGQSRDDGAIVVKIRDTGVGIAAQYLDRIAEPFVQADNGHKNIREGTGLGVTIATALARVHGGDLVYASEPGVGTLVTLTLPAKRLAARAAA